MRSGECQRQLQRARGGVPGNKVLQRGRDVETVHAAMLNDLVSELGRDIARPALGGVECDDASRIGILTVDQVGQDLPAIGALLVRLAPGAAEALAEIIKHQVDVDVVGRGWRNRGNAFTETPQQYCGDRQESPRLRIKNFR
jgi:hypothetical protein